MANETMEQAPAAVKDPQRTPSRTVYTPPVDIVENENELTLYADMPGVNPQDVEINFEEGTLTLHAKVHPRQSPATRFLLGEYGVGDFSRTFRVTEAIDSAGITADYRDGVLVLHLPKSPEAKPRKIAVNCCGV